MSQHSNDVVIHVEEEPFESAGRLKGGKLSHYIMPWMFVLVPLLILSFGGYILVVGLRNYSEPCDQSLASMLIAMGSLLVAPFFLACLFVPAFMTGSGGSDTEDMIVKGGVAFGIIDLVSFLLCLTIATVMYTGANKCHPPLVSAASTLVMISWVVFAFTCTLGSVLIYSRTQANVLGRK